MSWLVKDTHTISSAQQNTFLPVCQTLISPQPVRLGPGIIVRVCVCVCVCVWCVCLGVGGVISQVLCLCPPVSVAWAVLRSVGQGVRLCMWGVVCVCVCVCV